MLNNGIPLKSGLGVIQSLKTMPFNRPYTTLYQSAIVLSFTILELFDVQSVVTFKSRLGVITQDHWK